MTWPDYSRFWEKDIKLNFKYKGIYQKNPIWKKYMLFFLIPVSTLAAGLWIN